MNITTSPKAHWLAILIILTITSCNRPKCTNTNPIFDRSTPDSKEYRSEVASQIQRIGAGQLRYWFDEYEQKDAREYILVHVQGGGLCAKSYIRVNDWKGIEGLRGAAKGYSGAKLSGLRLAMVLDDSVAQPVFAGLDRIID